MVLLKEIIVASITILVTFLSLSKFCMKYIFSSCTSLFVVFIFSRKEVRRMDWVLVEADLDLFTRGWSKWSLCSFSSIKRCLISGSSHMSNGVSPFLVRALMFAPFWASNSTISKCPQQDAAWIGCHKSSSTTRK